MWEPEHIRPPPGRTPRAASYPVIGEACHGCTDLARSRFLLRISQAGEQTQVQAVVGGLAIEALDECTLSWVPGVNEMEFNLGTLRPEEHRLTGQLRVVIHNDASA